MLSANKASPINPNHTASPSINPQHPISPKIARTIRITHTHQARDFEVSLASISSSFAVSMLCFADETCSSVEKGKVKTAAAVLASAATKTAETEKIAETGEAKEYA